MRIKWILLIVLGGIIIEWMKLKRYHWKDFDQYIIEKILVQIWRISAETLFKIIDFILLGGN